MSIVDNIKDIARKATNSVVDGAENMIDKPKSPKEIAKRLIEHLNHQEYTKIAEILSDEAKKYAKHLGIDDFTLIETNLNNFEKSMQNIAANIEEGDYSQVASKLKEIEEGFPESMAGMTEVFTSLKSLLNDIAQVMEDYAQEGVKSLEEEKPDFSKLQEVFEGYFSKMISSDKKEERE